MRGNLAGERSIQTECVRFAGLRSVLTLPALLLAAAAVALAFSTPAARAQDTDSDRVRVAPEKTTAPTTAPAGDPARGRAEDARIERTVPLYVGESRLIDAPWPVARVSVNNPAVADLDIISPQQVQLHGISPGLTDFTMWSKDERVWRARVEVELDLRRLEGQLNQVFPRSRLKVSQVGEVIVVSGQLLRLEQALQLRAFLEASELNFLDMTSVAGLQQVQLKVRVAEVSRSALRSLGVNMFHSGQEFFGGIQIGSAAGPFTQMSGGIPSATPLHQPSGGLPFQTLSDIEVPPTATLFGGIDNIDLEVFIQALAENTYLRVLAEPTLVAATGEEANFLVGGEFPVPVAQIGGGGGSAGGSTSISIEYREFGVRLQFRPEVLGDGTIRLKIEPEVSELSDVGAIEVLGTRVPSLLTRRVNTTFEMQSGQTFALAGLLNRSTNARTSRVPGLGAIPILGSLFRSVRYQTNETELVILVSASLVAPQSLPMEDVNIPGVTHRPPGAWDLFAAGKLENDAPVKLPPTQQARLKELQLDRLHGPGTWANYDKEPRDSANDRK